MPAVSELSPPVPSPASRISVYFISPAPHSQDEHTTSNSINLLKAIRIAWLQATAWHAALLHYLLLYRLPVTAGATS